MSAVQGISDHFFIQFFWIQSIWTEGAISPHIWGFWYMTPIVDLLLMPPALMLKALRVNPHFSILSSRSGALSFTFYEQFFRFLSFYIYSYNSFNELIIHFFAVIRIFLVINFLYVRFFVLFATIAVSFFTFWKSILLF